MIDIFNKRWYGIHGMTVGEGKYKMNVVRIQTSDDGPWQALNDDELAKLLVEHNKMIYDNGHALKPKPATTKIIEKAKNKKGKKK